MKVSILTVCLNSQSTIQKTLNSVITQKYKNIEHIIVDGGSNDATQILINEYPFKNKKIFIKKKLKLYESLNFAIKKAKGDYILLLHSDDILNNNKVVSELVGIAKKKQSHLIVGSTVYFRDSESEIVRFFPSTNFKKEYLLKGLIIPHTGMFIKKNLHQKYMYNVNYKIAGDYDFFLRCILIDKNSFYMTRKIVSRMKTGGISGKNFLSYVTSTKEICRSLANNNLKVNSILIFLRFVYKIKQLIIINTSKLNKNFFYIADTFYKKKLKYDFIIYKNINKVLKKNKFILSAMNLAFLGSYIKNPELKFPHIYHWPDGISAKLLEREIKKIPGREILNNLNINKIIKRIVVIGNLSNLSKKKLFLKYNIKIINHKVPYADFKTIFKSIKLKFYSSDLILITLPTPKQELVAIELAKKMNHYKIICIGGSVAIFSGEEKEVPKLLNNLEFIWRLQYETLRRLKRLLATLCHVIFDYLWSQKIKRINVEIK
jgi:exopolysaccharide biosynthesis WecB/TagA/CpsF family protein